MKRIALFFFLLVGIFLIISCEFFLPESEKVDNPNFLSTSNKIVMSYYEAWKIWKPEENLARHIVEDIDFNIMTHIILAFADIQYDDKDNPTRFYISTGADLEMDNQMDDIIEEAHKNDVKVILSIGGWNFNDPSIKTNSNHNTNLYDGNHTAWIFTTLASDSSFRESFSESVVEYLQEHNLDGIDIDWEYPNIPSNNVLQDESASPYNDYENFPLLLKKIKEDLNSASIQTFDGSPYTLSIAVGGDAIIIDM